MKTGPFVIAIMLAVIAAIFVLRSGGGDSSSQQTTTQTKNISVKPARVETVNIYVAAQPIQIGSVISEDQLIEQPWPKHLMVDGFIVADGSNQIEGKVARSAFRPQEPIIDSKLANVNDPSFLAGSLPEGMRVVTIRTNEIDGLAGLLFPGDRIDVVLSREVENAIYENPDLQRFAEEVTVTENILNNVLVLAVDQKTEAAVETTNDNAGRGARRFTPPRSVSLMVTPNDARRLRLAEHIAVSASGNATLALSLRSLKDKDHDEEKLGITYVSDVSQYRPQIITASAQIAQQKSALVTVVRGTEIEDKQQKKQQLDIDDIVSSASVVTVPRSSGSAAR